MQTPVPRAVRSEVRIGWQFPVRPAADEADSRAGRIPAVCLFPLAGIVVASMVGAGDLSLPRPFDVATGPSGAIVASCIAGGRMDMPARLFQSPAGNRPGIERGVTPNPSSCVGNPTTGETTDAC